MEHAHHAWIGAVAQAVAAEYTAAREKLAGPENIQQRGHAYEALFRRLLSGWLPPQYEIGMRKYLLLEREINGNSFSHETDLVIFNPSYPRELRERSEVLLSGVVAAFGIKSELDPAGLKEAIEEAAMVRDGYEERLGSEIGELLSPLIYGVLAHTHKLPGGVEPRSSVTETLLAQAETASPPRKQLDLVCVADLDCWYRTTHILQDTVGATEPSENDLYIDYWHSAYGDPALSGMPALSNSNPIAALVTQLWAKLSTRDLQLKPIADGLRVTGTGTHSGPGRTRALTSVISSALHQRAFQAGSSRWFI
jgi:hypothetical protein